MTLDVLIILAVMALVVSVSFVATRLIVRGCTLSVTPEQSRKLSVKRNYIVALLISLVFFLLGGIGGYFYAPLSEQHRWGQLTDDVFFVPLGALVGLCLGLIIGILFDLLRSRK